MLVPWDLYWDVLNHDVIISWTVRNCEKLGGWLEIEEIIQIHDIIVSLISRNCNRDFGTCVRG